MGEEERWLSDSRFADDLKRGENGPVLSPQQVVDHPHIRAAGFVQAVDCPGLPKSAPVARAAVRLSETLGEIASRLPTLGEHGCCAGETGL